MQNCIIKDEKDLLTEEEKNLWEVYKLKGIDTNSDGFLKA